MLAARAEKEVFLMPGEYVLLDGTGSIRTVLGSCVALTLWHPRRRIGVMCHFMLPRRPRGAAKNPDGRYAEEAFVLIQRAASGCGARTSEFQLKMFGGGCMFTDVVPGSSRNIGRLNIEAAHALAQRYGLAVAAEDVGGTDYRRLSFDVQDGRVWVWHAGSPAGAR